MIKHILLLYSKINENSHCISHISFVEEGNFHRRGLELISGMRASRRARKDMAGRR